MAEAASKFQPTQPLEPTPRVRAEPERAGAAGAMARAALYLVRREDAPARRPRCEPPSPWIALRDLRW
ncbi:MAG: hypothetical protein QM704_21235 [Anaeromyxobacteraceae bacterium]